MKFCLVGCGVDVAFAAGLQGINKPAAVYHSAHATVGKVKVIVVSFSLTTQAVLRDVVVVGFIKSSVASGRQCYHKSITISIGNGEVGVAHHSSTQPSV